MNKALSIKILIGFLIVITIVNLIQSAYTGIIFDEAYYWYFAKNLSWGYFDHPPMVAFLVKLGTLLFQGELGVRLAAPFLYSANVILLWFLIDSEKKYRYIWLFIMFVSSVGLLTAYGFMILPDTPLITFSLLFLWAYKRFLYQQDSIAVLVLGFSMAAVMYCKYHGVLLIGFVLFSNLSLLKNGKFWLAVLFSLILYIPHLIWLYEADFAPLRYHLFDRANSAYKIKFTLNYLTNCIAVAGLAFPFMYWSLYALASKDKFDKALKFVAYGVFAFFLFSSFSRKTQAQWVILMVIPLILFSLRYAFIHTKYRKWLFRISVFSVILISILRVALIFPSISPINYEAYGNKEWVAHLNKQVGDIPVVFHSSYRDASMYAFYSGNTVYSSNDIDARQNQFDIDSSEFKVRNKKVAYITGDNRYKIDSTITYIREFRHHKFKGAIIDNFTSYRKMKLSFAKKTFKKSIPNAFAATLYNPYPENISVKKLTFEGVSFDKHKRIIKTFPLIISSEENTISPKGSIVLNVKVPDTVIIPNSKYFRMGILEHGIYPGFQGKLIKID
ncbi:glycosyltransferase family 39 protein [Galbibacter sp. PAP.153]|uniref:ArnT family glycosyltransferase n=1 Tax=Galbibacter sp. PAP.153 TaxID=3104623 RepID=UPI003008788B